MNTNRRNFLKISGIAMGALVGSQLIKRVPLAQAQAAPPMVNPKDGTAQAIKYVEDYKKAPQAKGNRCSNCSFYNKKQTLNNKEVGSCVIFPGKFVYGDAYCNSWAKKA